jgi:two-component system response regulator PilR (NtrC family)
MSDITPYLVGRCAAFEAFAARLSQVAAAEATVLIEGESGTGKGLAARAIHDLSPRAAGPFVAVSPAALAPSLIQAELFGHEEGAFTGAHRSRIGRFERASGGTLCLDDIDALAPETQAKLLRALQTRTVEPLGAESPRSIDVRLIATTQRDLAREVEAGRFRSDLYYRLAVVPLVVPPLRERLEDLPLLAAALIARLSAERGLTPRRLSSAALARLRAHPWPGNVRELENALERALVLAASVVPAQGAGENGGPPKVGTQEPALGELGPEDFEFLSAATLDAAEELAERALAQGLSLAELENAVIARALRRHPGNKAAAARAIGLSRRAFEYRLARLAPPGAPDAAPAGAEPGTAGEEQGAER